jgi:hypothetical protein
MRVQKTKTVFTNFTIIIFQGSLVLSHILYSEGDVIFFSSYLYGCFSCIFLCLSVCAYLSFYRFVFDVSQAVYNYFLRRSSSECPLISFDNGDHSNTTYLASTFILDYEVIDTYISSIDLFVHL